MCPFCSLEVVSLPYRFSPSLEMANVSTRAWFCRKPIHRLSGAQRTNYDLRERICIGSMTAMETAVYQKVPTDEAEAQMLATVDLDDMKSKSGSVGLAGYRIHVALATDCFKNRGIIGCLLLRCIQYQSIQVSALLLIDLYFLRLFLTLLNNKEDI